MDLTNHFLMAVPVDPEPVDRIDGAGTPVTRRVAPVLAVVAVVWVLKKLLTRNRD
jgi:hypothetical protein